MRRALAITRTGAAAALALLAAVGCGATGNHNPSPERITATPHASPSSGAGGPSSPGVVSTCAGAGSVGIAGSGVPALDTVQFVSATRGWAAGAGHILATSDGGRTWQSQYTGRARFDQVDFTDAAHGWAVATSALLATSDGGRTWTALPEPCGLIDSVRFVTPRVGYAVAGARTVRIDAGTPVAVNGGRLLETTDGGRTWNAVTGAPVSAQSVCFTSPSAGFLGTPGRVWRTTDGGARWSASFTEPPAAGARGEPPDATALECAGGSAAWTLFLGSSALLGHEGYLAYATQDARTWHVLFEETYIESGLRPEVHAPDGPGSYPGPVSAIDAGSAAYVGWTPPAGLGAAPLELATGGTRLTKAGNVGGVTQPNAAAFVAVSRGWVVGADQTTPSQPGRDVIEATADGGRTWTRQYTAP
jgi:photosystem II stability/assembly factor-like uncharacterized protein